MTFLPRGRALIALGALALAGVVGSAAEAEGQAVRRMGKWQFNIPLSFTNGSRIDGEGGSSLEVSDDLGWGFGFGYHFNQRFMLGFESNWLGANYTAEIEFDEDEDGVGDGFTQVGGRLDAASFGLLGQFNLLERSPLTPFLQGKLGWTYTDSNIPSAPVQGVCWWDPWWGYVCNTWQPTYNTWDFSYGGGIGLRAQLGPAFFLEASYNALWIDYDRDTRRTDGFRLNIGFMN